MLTELVRERLAHVLAENRPRRASPAELRRSASSTAAGERSAGRSTAESERRSAVFARAAATQVRSVGSSPPDFEPSDDGEEGADDRPQRPQAQPRTSTQARPGVGHHLVEDGGSAAPRRSLHPGPDQSLTATHRPADGNGEEPSDLVDDWVEPAPRRGFGRAHVGVICALLLIGLLSAGWAVLRARPVAIASTPPTTAAPSMLRSPAAAPAGSPTSAASSIMVHVLGAVEKPGVVTLPEHARVRDAIKAAGGLRREAAPGDLNLAQVLSDGQQVVIGTDKDPSGEVRDGGRSTGSSDGSGTGSSSSDAAGPKVNLNSASQSQLEELPGVGPVTAGKIVAWREEHGRFSRVEELQEVDGIGPKTFAEIAPHARV